MKKVTSSLSFELKQLPQCFFFGQPFCSFRQLSYPFGHTEYYKRSGLNKITVTVSSKTFFSETKFSFLSVGHDGEGCSD